MDFTNKFTRIYAYFEYKITYITSIEQYIDGWRRKNKNTWSFFGFAKKNMTIKCDSHTYYTHLKCTNNYLHYEKNKNHLGTLFTKSIFHAHDRVVVFVVYRVFKPIAFTVCVYIITGQVRFKKRVLFIFFHNYKHISYHVILVNIENRKKTVLSSKISVLKKKNNNNKSWDTELSIV
ncbi:hypothetical protein AGLY_013250 [Aphis glycines]|uniref:Uncharacterized protein n=1 Tax=Aphis glycines TaxID=307491 RepID=A0A6G0T730_APHGL|nr:hypothetical protein AGLY_013250 [Aphis glycines]